MSGGMTYVRKVKRDIVLEKFYRPDIYANKENGTLTKAFAISNEQLPEIFEPLNLSGKKVPQATLTPDGNQYTSTTGTSRRSGFQSISCGCELFVGFIEEKRESLASYSKGQFCKNTVYLERGMPYFAFVDTNSVLVRKIDKV